MFRPLLPIGLIIAAVAGFFMFIDPQYKTYQGLQAQKAEVSSALDKVGQVKAELSRLLTEEDSISKDNLDRLAKIVPTNVDNIRLFMDLQSIAKKYNISIQQISASDKDSKNGSNAPVSPDATPFGQITLSFSVSTSYESLLLFLKDVEKSLRIVEIKSITFVSDPKHADLYKVSLAVNTYWLKSNPITQVSSTN